MKLFIKTINNVKTPIEDVDPEWTVARLKKYIEEKMEISAVQQRLSYNGEPLADVFRIKTIPDGAVIYLIRQFQLF